MYACEGWVWIVCNVKRQLVVTLKFSTQFLLTVMRMWHPGEAKIRMVQSSQINRQGCSDLIRPCRRRCMLMSNLGSAACRKYTWDASVSSADVTWASTDGPHAKCMCDPSFSSKILDALRKLYHFLWAAFSMRLGNTDKRLLPRMLWVPGFVSSQTYHCHRWSHIYIRTVPVLEQMFYARLILTSK